MKKMAVGIMSGTSMDGIDVVIGSIEGSYIQTQVELIAHRTYPIEEALKKRIHQAIDDKTSSAELICSLNMELGYAFGLAAKKLMDEKGISSQDILFVASHGQTVWHINEDHGSLIKSSMQLGDASAIASITKTTVISNFRPADIAAGGVGAPLVPYVDFLLFTHKKKSRSLHNLGGISNMTVLKAGGQEDDVIAFDTGPANMMIDRAMSVLYHQSYDRDGRIARSGKMIHRLFETLKHHPYLKKQPPKSTGREMFGDSYTDSILQTYQQEKPEDIMRTLTEFTVYSIVDAYRHMVLPIIDLDEIIFSGGGAFNSYILERIQQELPDIKVLRLEDFGFSSQAKEALAFMILGNETLHRKPSNMLKATGAKHRVILGQVYYWIE